jgi:hypothetical protein
VSNKVFILNKIYRKFSLKLESVIKSIESYDLKFRRLNEIKGIE